MISTSRGPGGVLRSSVSKIAQKASLTSACIPAGMQAEVKDAFWAIFDTEDLKTPPGPRLVEIIGVEDRPEGVLDPGRDVPAPVHKAALAQRLREHLLDRGDQPGGAV